MMINGLTSLNNVLMNEAGAEGGAGGGGAAPAPAPAAPAPAPAEPAPAQAPAEPAPAPQEPAQEAETHEFAETGDPTMDYVLGYVGEQGIGYDHPALQAALKGDFGQLEVELAKKNAPGSDRVLAMAQRVYEQHEAAENERNAATGNMLIEAAGSLEDWETTVEWARENGTDDEKAAVNDMLAAGGAQAQIAAQFLVSQHRAAQGTEFEGQPASTPSAAAAPSASNEPLTRVQFAQEAEKLYRQHGNDYMQTPQYAALVNRRQR